MENLQSDHLDTQNLYRDMQKRTGGEIYIGVVGPVRTGKSTFIKRFMDVAVLPYMEEGLDAAAIVGKLGNQFSEEDIRTSVAECEKLREEGMLFTKDVYENAIDAFTKNRQTVVKALCLHMTVILPAATALQKKGNITEDVPLCLLRWARRHWISLSPIRAPDTIWRLTFSAASRL